MSLSTLELVRQELNTLRKSATVFDLFEAEGFPRTTTTMSEREFQERLSDFSFEPRSIDNEHDVQEALALLHYCNVRTTSRHTEIQAVFDALQVAMNRPLET